MVLHKFGHYYCEPNKFSKTNANSRQVCGVTYFRAGQQLLQLDSAMSRFLLVVATLLGKNRAITPRVLSKC